MTDVSHRGEPLDPALLEAAPDRGRTISEHRAGHLVFSQGDDADSVFYVLRGLIKIVVTSAQGREAVVALLGERDFFGEGCLIGQKARRDSAMAMSRARLLRFDKAEMSRILHSEPAFADLFTAHLLTRNSRFEADVADHLLNSSEKRLARLLLLLADFGRDSRPQPIAGITQETLAEMVGTTRSRVSYFMNKFRRLGFIDYNGKLLVNGSLLNVVLTP